MMETMPMQAGSTWEEDIDLLLPKITSMIIEDSQTAPADSNAFQQMRLGDHRIENQTLQGIANFISYAFGKIIS